MIYDKVFEKADFFEFSGMMCKTVWGNGILSANILQRLWIKCTFA
jgi:hypothetical protein